MALSPSLLLFLLRHLEICFARFPNFTIFAPLIRKSQQALPGQNAGL